MDFEWDEGKRLKNIEKHGLDFNESDVLFEGPHVIGLARSIHGESREMIVGLLSVSVYVTAIFTRRGSTIRIISMRRARYEERRHHQQIFGR